MEKKKLKISLLVPSRGLSGGMRSSVVVGNELLSRGHDVRIFYRNRVLSFRRRLGRIYNRLRYGPGKDWLSTFKGPSFGYDKLDPDKFSSDEIILSMCAHTTLDLWSLPKSVGIKVIYCRGAEIENWENMLKTWKLPIPKIAVSLHLAELIKKETNQSVIGVVSNGVDTNIYFPCLPESERTGIGTILGSSRPKDPDTAIRVMRILGKRLPDVPRYMFSFARSHYRLGKIHFKRQPTVAEARKMYSSCKVWFLSSISEGCPNPILEAMACGCAVVSTDCGGPRDIIQDGVNGFLVGVGNAGAMVYKIMMLYKDDNLRERICANAMKTVQGFTWPQAVDKLEEYLYSIYNKSICSNE